MTPIFFVSHAMYKQMGSKGKVTISQWGKMIILGIFLALNIDSIHTPQDSLNLYYGQ
jgi:hypothetical protein